MARIRTIKPEFFMSEDIGKLTVQSRLLYVALWCHADRMGIMKFAPMALAAQTMPFEMENFLPCLNELINNEHILLYEVESRKYLFIPTFLDHQRPHNTERESNNPPFNSELTVKQPLKDGECLTGKGKGKGKGKDNGKGVGKGTIVEAEKEIIKQSVDYLNEKAGTKYKHSGKKVLLHLPARLHEGFTLEDIKQVIDTKVAGWKDDIKMQKFLRPETLFGNKFESYLNEKPVQRHSGAMEWAAEMEQNMEADNA